MVTQKDENKGNSGIKPKSSVNWKDYVVFFVLVLPIIVIVAWPVSRSLAHSIVTFVSYGSLPIVYLGSRILGWSRKRAFGLAVAFYFLAILVGWYTVERRPFLGTMSDGILIGFIVGALWYLLKQKR